MGHKVDEKQDLNSAFCWSWFRKAHRGETLVSIEIDEEGHPCTSFFEDLTIPVLKKLEEVLSGAVDSAICVREMGEDAN